MPVALAAAQEPSPPTTVRVRTDAFPDVARTFADAQVRVRDVIGALRDRLVANQQAIGKDESAQVFAQSYHAATDMVFAALVKLHGIVGAVGRGIAFSGNNHIYADAVSAGASTDNLDFYSPYVEGLIAAPATPDITGRTPSWLPGILDHVWPNKDDDKLGAVAQAFDNAHSGLDAILYDLHSALTSLVEENQSDDLRALEQFWNTLAGNNDGALFTATMKTLADIAKAVRDYGAMLDDFNDKLTQAVIEAALEAAAESGLAILIDVLTDGVASVFSGEEGAAIAARAVSHLAGVVEQIVAAVRTAGSIRAITVNTEALSTAIGNAPEPNLETAVAQRQGDLLGGPSAVTWPQLSTPRQQIEKKYGHAGDFGVLDPRGKPGFDNYATAVQAFVADPATVKIWGVYNRGNQRVIINFNTRSGLMVMQQPDGTFISGWRMSSDQLQKIIATGRIGGDGG
jgi:hypothetical protein